MYNRCDDKKRRKHHQSIRNDASPVLCPLGSRHHFATIWSLPTPPATDRLFDHEARNLPGRPVVVNLLFQFLVAVKRVYDEERAFVTNRHVLAVPL